MKDAETKHRFIALRGEEKSLRTIARELGIGRETARRWDDKFKEQVEDRKVLELEALREEYLLTEKARSDRIWLSMNTRAICRKQPLNKISDFGTNDMSVPPPCAHQAVKTLRDKDSVSAEVKEVV